MTGAALIALAMSFAAPPRPCDRLRPAIAAAAREARVDEALVAGIVWVESGFRAEVKSRSKARGPMQIMPSTARATRCGDIDDPRENIRCGAALLAGLIGRYDGRVMYAVAAYHKGSRAPDAAFRKKVPIDLRYVEAVLAARTRWLRGGCPR